LRNLSTIQNIYFLGIGGIGMSAIARYFLQQGVVVSGYDKTPSALTKKLQQEGAIIHYDDEAHLFPTEPEMVVYTPAIPSTHIALDYYKTNNITIYKRSEILEAITANATTIAVAGTHGKTTTSSLVGHIFKHAQQTTTVFLGGISANYNTNYWPQETGKNIVVVEADEYDRSFHKLMPSAAIVTSMDADHLDIYGNVENLQEAFHVFIDKIKPGGILVHKYDLPITKRNAGINYISYDANNCEADVYAGNIKVANGLFEFVCYINGKALPMKMATGGRYNIENALAACAIALHLGLTEEQIIAAVNKFEGVKRRFEYYIRNENQVFIDDYAHHPAELKVTIAAAKELYPNKKCSVVFQPHLYSRTNDFFEAFGNSLNLADETILLPIYPARELPMEGVTSQLIANGMTNNVMLKTKEEYLAWLKTADCELLLSTGAGDIDDLNIEVKNILEQKNKKK
jgi:UDP-N-acetylmuramate--alanine ligase